MELTCEKCNKLYKSYQSLWNHNKKFHSKKVVKTQPKSINNDTNNKQQNINVVIKPIQNICNYCNKQLSDRHSKWRHEKTCKVKKQKMAEEDIYKKQADIIAELITKVEKLEKKSKISKKIINYNGPITNLNTNSNNTLNTQNNNLSICNPGQENVNLLSTNEKKYIMSQGLNSIISLVDQLNFNEDLPQHHNFYVSAINDKHVNTLDNKTNSIIKKSKKDLFDEILFNHMNKLESINKNINYKDFNTIFDKLKAFVYLKQGKKEFFNQINMLSYNKKNMIIKTWEKLIEDSSINPDEVSNKFEDEVKQITEQQEDDSISDSDSDSDSDSEKPILNLKKYTPKNIEI